MKATFSIRRGGRAGGEMVDYTTDVTEGMVVLDAIHQVQLHYAKADVSITAMFNPRVRFPKGAITGMSVR